MYKLVVIFSLEISNRFLIRSTSKMSIGNGRHIWLTLRITAPMEQAQGQVASWRHILIFMCMSSAVYEFSFEKNNDNQSFSPFSLAPPAAK